MRTTVVSVCLAALAACGGSDGPGPGPGPGPTPTATSITVSLRNVVLVGTTAPATGTATLTNGQSQAVTTGWRSDAPSVATVTDSGTVTGVGNGMATIYVVFGGVQGDRQVRVAPNYDGRWAGRQQISECIATGDWRGICEEDGGFVGAQYPIGLNARHPGDLSVSGEFSIEDVPFPTFTADVEGDGTIRFSGRLEEDGVRWDASWQINSAESARASGSIREVFSVPGVLSGDVTLVSQLVNFARGGGALAPAGPLSFRSRLATVRSRIPVSRR